MHTLKSAQLFEEITKTILEHVEFEDKENNSTDGVITVLSEIADSVQEEFEELVGISSDKRYFIKGLIKIFTLLLNTNVRQELKQL